MSNHTDLDIIKYLNTISDHLAALHVMTGEEINLAYMPRSMGGDITYACRISDKALTRYGMAETYSGYGPSPAAAYEEARKLQLEAHSKAELNAKVEAYRQVLLAEERAAGEAA